MTIDLTKLSSLHDLIIGFYSGAALGNIASDLSFSMTIDMNINGTDHKATVLNVSAANAFFNNGGLGDAIDLGQLSGTSLQLDISLSITESEAGGYDFGMLIGDPPALGHAAASFPSGASANTGGSGSPAADNAPWLGPHHGVT